MINCKKCEYKSEKFFPFCPECGAEFSASDSEMTALSKSAEELMRSSKYTDALDILRYLAEHGFPIGEREFGKILERGLLIPKNLAAAEDYYRRAAEKGDRDAAYLLSRLMKKRGDILADFWLKYSAFSGHVPAYTDAARSYRASGESECALYYFELAARQGDRDASREACMMLLSGEGCERCPEAAKWYFKRARGRGRCGLGLRIRLHPVKESEPPAPTLENPKRMIKALRATALRQNFSLVSITLTERLCEYGEPGELTRLGQMLLESTGDVRRAMGISDTELEERAILTLEAATEGGSAEAAMYLGALYERGEVIRKDHGSAVRLYKKAAELGERVAYLALGRLYLSEDSTERNIPLAIEAFDEGARAGDGECREMAASLRDTREELYSRAEACEGDYPEEAFSLYARSRDMGYPPAISRLARCYEYGYGTKKDRRIAFGLYLECVENKDYTAAYDLGRCYAYGIGTRFDFELAVKYLSLAKRQGIDEADAEIFRLYENKKRHMTHSLYSTASRLLYKKKYAPAHRMLSLCAELGCAEAMLTLGALYEFGIGTVPDRESALTLYERARGHARARKIKQRILTLHRS